MEDCVFCIRIKNELYLLLGTKNKGPYQLMGKGPEHSHVNRCGFQNGKNRSIPQQNKMF